jgi:hypothetical protein
LTNDTYVASNGRLITRITLEGREGDVPFVAFWVEGHGDIGDRIIGRYSILREGAAECSGEMFE